MLRTIAPFYEKSIVVATKQSSKGARAHALALTLTIERARIYNIQYKYLIGNILAYYGQCVRTG